MEREANYAAVGGFVLLVLAMTVAFVYWYSDAREARSYERHEIYFEGSVSGLSVGSTVRYLGVDVGRVVALNIDRRSAERVQVIVDIDSAAPVSSKTVAELSLLGVTGLLYVDLLGDAGSKRLVPPVESERYPVIRSVRSGFDVILSGVPEVMGRVSEVAQRASRLLSDDNLEALSRTVASIDRASRDLPATMKEVDSLVRELRTISRDFSQMTQALQTATVETTPAIRKVVDRIGVVADNLATTSARLDELVRDNATSVNDFAQNGLPELERLMREGSAAADELESLGRSLREDPSRVIYSPPPRGIEVPR
jgi:phospholipid/cholesterol/gamma-HCH transport system substrate-binding protein